MWKRKKPVHKASRPTLELLITGADIAAGDDDSLSLAALATSQIQNDVFDFDLDGWRLCRLDHGVSRVHRSGVL